MKPIGVVTEITLQEDPRLLVMPRYRRKASPSDLTDAPWAIIAPLLPAPENTGGGRPREVEMREGLNTLLYLNRRGCRGERRPQDLLPKRSG